MSSRSSTEERQAELPDTVEVARIRSPHGVRGGVAVDVLSDVEGRLDAGSELLLKTVGGDRRTVRILASRPHKTGRVVVFEGFEAREEAATLRGAVLEVPRSQVPPAEDGFYYQFELVGCLCSDADEGELGVVTDVLEDGGGLLLQVEGAGMSILIPFVDAVVTGVDIDARRIELQLPEGLIEQCASRQ